MVALKVTSICKFRLNNNSSPPSNQKIFVATRTDILCAQDTHVHISCGSVDQSGRISCVIARRSQTASSNSIFPSAHHGLSVQRWSHMWHQHEIRGKPPQCRPRTFEANHSKLCVQFCFSSKPSSFQQRFCGDTQPPCPRAGARPQSQFCGLLPKPNFLGSWLSTSPPAPFKAQLSK